MELIYTKNAPFPVGPYSQAVKANGFVYCSGQIAIDPHSNEVLKDAPIETQTEMCLKNLSEVLKAAGSSLQKVIKVNIYLIDMEDFGAVNEIYTRYFSETKPARACVAVKELPKEVSVEIEAIAMQ